MSVIKTIRCYFLISGKRSILNAGCHNLYKLAQRTARLIENHTLIRCFVSYLLQLSIEQIQRTRTLFLLNSITRSSTELNVQFL